jgi:hypothetical protein
MRNRMFFERNSGLHDKTVRVLTEHVEFRDREITLAWVL